ncbi:MAG: CDP-glycerol glycerophosphotransferase family protein [Eubacterium sp.]|nr:CDP-glycerol glycerophosphotransferase family protein [Eubacterium sp.]
MAEAFSKLFGFAINFVYFFFKLKKTENKITFISRQSNTPSLDFCCLINELKKNYPQYRVDVLCKMIPSGLSGKISYIFEMLRQMKSLASSRVAVIDGYSIPVCMLKHKRDLTVIQMWHALGAVKKFGWQSVGTKEGRSESISKAMRMHKNYDYVLAPSRKTAAFYSEGFDISLDRIKVLPLPRVDFILDGKDRKEEFYSLNPHMKNRKVVLYLPTFRSGEAMAASLLKKQFENKNEYQLVFSTHPLSEVKMDEEFSAKGNFSSYDLMKLADVIITDYSACAFEASLLLKPLYFFIPDYEDYMENRGINVDVKKEFPSAAFENAEMLADAIEKNDYDMNSLIEFKEKYVENADTNSTENLVKFILKQM